MQSVGGKTLQHLGTVMTKTWFITGTSSGFGRILTEKLLERGDRVAATLRRPEALNELKKNVRRPFMDRRSGCN